MGEAPCAGDSTASFLPGLALCALWSAPVPGSSTSGAIVAVPGGTAAAHGWAWARVPPGCGCDVLSLAVPGWEAAPFWGDGDGGGGGCSGPGGTCEADKSAGPAAAPRACCPRRRQRRCGVKPPWPRKRRPVVSATAGRWAAAAACVRAFVEGGLAAANVGCAAASMACSRCCRRRPRQDEDLI